MSYNYELQDEIKKKNIQIAELQKACQLKDEKIADLVSQLDKYRSIFKRQLPNSRLNLSMNFSNDTQTRSRALGISAEPQTKETLIEVDLIKIPKSTRSQAVIRKAILDNEFMRNLHQSQIQSIIDCMKPVTFPAHSIIIEEGGIGSMVYVLEEGIMTVSKNGKLLREIVNETVFGELAILYNCTRTATITAVVNCNLWSIDRQSFQAIMMKTGLMKQQENLQFLKSVPNFQAISEDKLRKIADILEELSYENEEYIIRQGGRGDTFYIISKGKVRVTQITKSGEEEKFIRFMNKGDWFGEKALVNEDVRTANIIADDENGVSCLVLDRESYLHLIGDCGLQRNYPDELVLELNGKPFLFENATIEEFERTATLGIGGFGRVELVKFRNDSSQSFALKIMKKTHIVNTRQQEHVMNERNILFQLKSSFIVRLFHTMKDSKFLYMVMEVCLGGELWSILRDRSRFDDCTTRFYIASVVEALNYIHMKSIVYRDLKPENILLDNCGYIKLTDFGFAKKVAVGRKTWTFCGTPEYVAPEVILNKGHDNAADVWSLGILIYELLTGLPPFYAADPMKVYNLILKGIDTVNFDKTSRNAQNLIKKLCRDNPSDRLGYGNEGIKSCQKHIWFESFNWEGIISRTLPAPIVQKVSSPLDHSNFDDYPEDTSVGICEDNSGWDNYF